MPYHPRWPSQSVSGAAHRRRQIAYGRWQPYVDAEPARQHVLALRAAGMGPVTIARASGVSHGALAKLVYGDKQRGLAPSKRIRPETATKILAVEPKLEYLADGAMVPAFGTQRRIKALHAIGWSLTDVARRAGVDRVYMSRMLRLQKVTARNARAVDAVFRELCMTPGPSERARKHTQRNNWKPPLWWDNIDDRYDRVGGSRPASKDGAA